MEGRRRSVNSEYEFHERRTAGKMKAPLAMVLSFNDNDVHPDCPNISNPYHKCGRHCLDKIPIGRKYLDAIRSGGDQEWKKKSENKGVNLNCPFASNPYHKCDEYCLGKSSEKRQNGGKDQSKKPKGAPKKTIKDKVHLNRSASGLNKLTVFVFEDIPKKEHLKGDMKSKKENEIDLTTQRELSSLCKNASKPYHVCDEYCFKSVPEKESYGQAAKSKEESEIIETVEQIVNLEYKNALNTSVVSSEYCFESVPEREQHEQIIRLKSTRGGDKFLNNRHRTGFDRLCKHASKPHHECTEFCLKLDEEAIKPKEGKIIVVPEQGVKLEGRSASNSDYVPAGNGFESVPEREHHRPTIKPKEESKIVVVAEQGVKLEGRIASNSDYVPAENGFQSVPEREQHRPSIKPKEERKIVVVAEQGVKLEGRSASNSDYVPSENGLQSVLKKEQQRSKKTKGVSFKIEKSSPPPDNKHISNAYHEVIEDRFDDNREQEHPNGALTKSMEKEAVVPLEKVNPQCKRASNPYHVCAKYCFQNVSNGHHPVQPMVKLKEEKKAMPSPQAVNLDCKYTSNPYHVCAEYCFENVLERDPPKQTIKKLKKEDTAVFSSERRVNPECKFASNPYHACAEYCFQNAVEGEQQGQEKPKGAPKKTIKDKVHLNRSASGINKLTVYVFEDIPKKGHPKGDMTSKKENKIDLTTQHELSSLCKNTSKPYHVCDEYCFQSAPEREGFGQVIKLKSSKEGEKVMSNIESTEKTKGVSFKFEKSSPLPDNKHILNPYHEVIEDRFDDNPEQEHPNGVVKPKEERIVVTTERRVDLLCKYSSNHYHESLAKSMEKEAVVPLERVNPQCKRASNPYHVCAEYCFQNFSNGHHPVQQPIKKLKEEDTAVLSSERRVNPECKFASNPYHACAEYCFQNAVEGEQQGQVLKQRSLIELKNLVSNKKIASGNPHCEYSSNPYHQCAEYCFNKNVPSGRLLDRVMKTNERKKENRHALRRDDNPKYKNASKSFNRCSEYSPEETSPKSEAVEGSTATINQKKRNSSQGNKQNLPIAEKKISLNSNYMEASKPGQNYVESPERIILQDGIEKRGSMDETKDMQSVGIGEVSSTRNGNGNGDSENTMEKRSTMKLMKG